MLLLCQCQANNGSKQDEGVKQITNKSQKVSNAQRLKKERKAIVKGSWKAFMGNLKKAILEGGVQYAIKFCAVKAMGITDQLSKAYNVKLTRGSHKNRSPSNEADNVQEELIKRYKTQLKKSKSLKPSLIKRKKKRVYYHPIKIKKGLCLNCHGEKGKTLSAETFKLLRNEYPNGEAVGFEFGDLRGLLKIQFQAQYV